MRPTLTRNLTMKDFQDYYWLKKELQVFCKDHNIASSGSKEELTKRIELFLKDGTIEKVVKKKKINTSNEIVLSLDTIIDENHRCSQRVRYFFKEHIPNFHFSTHIQDYFKNNIGKTYADAINEWHLEEERKKEVGYQRKIGSQFQYNQFIRDFFQDEKNKGKSKKDAIEAWNEIKSKAGSNKYKSSK